MERYMTNFSPYVHGFHFKNSFKNVLVKTLLGSLTTSGRCGGMAFASLDYYHAGLPIPLHIKEDFPNGETPEGTLGKYIYDRLLDSFSGYNLKKFIQLTAKLDHYTRVYGEGTPQLTKSEEFPKLREKIKDGPVVLGLIKADHIWDLSKNHQVVAYGYEFDEPTGKITIYVYDNNFPDLVETLISDNNDLYFHSGLLHGDPPKIIKYRGFFVEEYSPKKPTYLDIGITKDILPSALKLRLKDPLDCVFTVRNFGEYPVGLSSLYVSVLGPAGENLDNLFGSDNNNSQLQPGEERVYYKHCDRFGGTAFGKYVLKALCVTLNRQYINNLPVVFEFAAFGRVLLPSKEVMLDVSFIYEPPFVESVEIIKTSSGEQLYDLKDDSSKCVSARTEYFAKWEKDLNGKRVLRKQTQPLIPNPCRDFKIIIKFATQGAMKDETVKLNLLGKAPDNRNINIPVKLTGNSVYYSGSFNPENRWSKNYELTLEIQGADSVFGDVIDSNPATVARVELSEPPLYPFINYEPGIDRQHTIEIGTKIMTLAADPLETNNNFVTAYRITLDMPDPVNGDWRKFAKLNFQDSADEDYFALEYQCQQSDDNYAFEEPTTECLSEFLGLYVIHYPPFLQVTTMAENDNCTDINIHKSDKFNRILWQAMQKSNQFRIYNPTKIFDDKKLYIAVMNTSYKCQGAFSYDLEIGYVPGQDHFYVDTNAPAYQGRPDVKHRFLKRYFDAIDLPRPPDELLSNVFDRSMPYPSTLYTIGDMKSFVGKYEKFLTQPQTIKDLKSLSKIDTNVVVAEELYNLGKASKVAGLVDEAEKIYLNSSKIFAKFGQIEKQVAVLKDLVEVYNIKGMQINADKILQDIKSMPQ